MFCLSHPTWGIFVRAAQVGWDSSRGQASGTNGAVNGGLGEEQESAAEEGSTQEAEREQRLRGGRQLANRRVRTKQLCV